jgi:hypothetical protein
MLGNFKPLLQIRTAGDAIWHDTFVVCVKLPVMYASMCVQCMSLPFVPPLGVSPYRLKEGNGDRSEGCLGARQVRIHAMLSIL